MIEEKELFEKRKIDSRKIKISERMYWRDRKTLEYGASIDDAIGFLNKAKESKNLGSGQATKKQRIRELKKLRKAKADLNPH